MCELTNTKLKATVGYKLVAYDEINNLFLSTFTGQVYMDGLLPKIEEGNSLSTYWISRFSRYDGCFTKDMVGRTAVFLSFENLMQFINQAREGLSGLHIRCKYNFELKLVIVKAKVSYNVVAGKHHNNDVAAGRKITFLEIIEYL